MGLCAPQTPSISRWKLFLNKVSSLTYDGINTFMFCQANQEAIESNTINTWYKIFDEMNRRTTTKKDNIYNISRRLICFNLLSCEKCYHQELYLTVSALPENIIAGMDDLQCRFQERMHVHTITCRISLNFILCSAYCCLRLVLKWRGKCRHCYHYLTWPVSPWHQGLVTAIKFLYKFCK